MDPIVPLSQVKSELLKLPQELQDVIFGFAYLPNAQSTFVNHADWATREQARRLNSADDDLVARSFPSPKVDDFMASKKFFKSAAKAYMGQAALHVCEAGATVLETMTSQGIGLAYVTRLAVVGLCDARGLAKLPNLKYLTVEPMPHEFHRLEPRHVCLDEFKDADFANIFGMRNILTIRELKEFTISVRPFMLEIAAWKAKSTAQSDMRSSNLSRLEQFIKSHVTKSRQTIGASTGRSASESMPLYHRSAVCAGSHQLAPQNTSVEDDESDGNTSSVVNLLGLPREMKGKILTSADIPEDAGEFLKLFAVNREGVMRWVRAAKAADG